MGKFIDLTGKKFGKWTVIKRADNNKHNQTCWVCKCDCGNEAIITGTNLKRGNSKSCGCLRLEKTQEKEVGKRYGRLIVLKQYGFNQSGRMTYLCKCDCGNEIITRIDALKDKKTVSCGCYLRELAKEKQKKAVQVGRFEGTKVQNLTSKISSSNTSGYKGIHRAKKNGKEAGWIVRIGIKGERKYIGCFTNFEDAIKARQEAEEKYHKPVIEKYRNQEVVTNE